MILEKFSTVLLMAAYLACVIVFVALPFLAGVGLSVLIHGTASVRDGALPWIVRICAGPFLAGMLLGWRLDDLIERFIPGNKIAGEVVGFLASVGVIIEGYLYFFVDYLPAPTAAFISELGLLVFLPMVKRSEHNIKRLEP
ncbi:hypothetical protein [Paeniglutamicibacter sp.]|uniref:hypothetical protein n=1 Tax=Paeniglutamicibacter sp. TaxID=1934391 RepID=UPI003989A654